MASLDYETEKAAFRNFYDTSRPQIEAASTAYITLIRSLLATKKNLANAKVEGRVKDREECVSKFRRKYQTSLEVRKREYTIRDHITDLIGVRVICFYEDEVEQIRQIIADEFEVIDITDKTAQIEDTEASFGYKGVHLDLELNAVRHSMKEYATCAEFPFELQIRTVTQDSWSTLDHKIKYKKSIPNALKRRINTLAALFELADREFREIRDGTAEAIKANEAYEAIDEETVEEPTETPQMAAPERPARRYTPLDAFSLSRIARHFFNNEDFEAHKIDGFTQEVIDLERSISRGKFNFYLRKTIGEVRRYKAEFESRADSNIMNPFTEMRHCLYRANPDNFAPMLTDRARESFDDWISEQERGKKIDKKKM
jgi:ppGpp synthetase/RelA/SpoT-type nucleotidyltranferase